MQLNLERVTFGKLVDKFEAHAINAPPGSWTGQEMKAWEKQQDGMIVVAGLLVLGYLAFQYLSQYGPTIKPIIDYVTK